MSNVVKNEIVMKGKIVGKNSGCGQQLNCAHTPYYEASSLSLIKRLSNTDKIRRLITDWQFYVAKTH